MWRNRFAALAHVYAFKFPAKPGSQLYPIFHRLLRHGNYTFEVFTTTNFRLHGSNGSFCSRADLFVRRTVSLCISTLNFAGTDARDKCRLLRRRRHEFPGRCLGTALEHCSKVVPKTGPGNCLGTVAQGPEKRYARVPRRVPMLQETL